MRSWPCSPPHLAQRQGQARPIDVENLGQRKPVTEACKALVLALEADPRVRPVVLLFDTTAMKTTSAVRVPVPQSTHMLIVVDRSRERRDRHLTTKVWRVSPSWK